MTSCNEYNETLDWGNSPHPLKNKQKKQQHTFTFLWWSLTAPCWISGHVSCCGTVHQIHCFYLPAKKNIN